MKYEQKQIVNYHSYESDLTPEQGIKLARSVVKEATKEKRMKRNMKKILGCVFTVVLALVFIFTLIYLYPYKGW